MKKVNLELQKKWHDFINPTRAEHYGYSFKASELRQFPEGRKILLEYIKTERSELKFRRLSKELGMNAARVMRKMLR